MLHLREHGPRSWPRRVRPVGKRDASDACSGERPSPGWPCAVRMVSCSPYLGTGQTFLSLLCHSLTRLSIQCCWLPRLWSSWFSLYGIMQENIELPAGERKERWMIRVLTQIIARQVLSRKEGPCEKSDPPPSPDAPGAWTLSLSHPRSRAKDPSAGTEPLATGRWSDPQIQALVVLFTQLAQRRMRALHQQEEIHE